MNIRTHTEMQTALGRVLVQDRIEIEGQPCLSVSLSKKQVLPGTPVGIWQLLFLPLSRHQKDDYAYAYLLNSRGLFCGMAGCAAEAHALVGDPEGRRYLCKDHLAAWLN